MSEINLQDKAEALALAILTTYEDDEKERQKYSSQREYYKTHLYEYLVEKFGMRKEEIIWSLLPEYEKHIWDGDKDPLKQLIDCIVNSQWAAVESGKGVGKTALAARIAYWFFESFDNSIIVTVAPKKDQLNLNIWKELNLLWPRFNKGKKTDLKIQMIPGSNDWLITGFVAGTGVIEQVAQKAAGIHAPHMLFFLEEGPGINQKVIDAFISTCSSEHNIIVMFGNPDHQLDNLHKFGSLPNVKLIRISGYDHPNVVLKNPDYIQGAQTEVGLQRILQRFGSKENPLYLSHARGISPSSSPDALIQMEWISKCKELYSELQDESGTLDMEKVKLYNLKLNHENKGSLGVDVANSEAGDKAAITYGIGLVPVTVETFSCPNANQLGFQVHRKAVDLKIDKDKVKVDGIGVGAGTVNILIDNYDYSKDEIDFQSSASPVEITGNTEQFNNIRSQGWWMLREAIRVGKLPIPPIPSLISELTTPKWTVKNGLICVESKADIKKRIGHSPNEGDSFVYWNWNNVYTGATYNVFIG